MTDQVDAGAASEAGRQRSLDEMGLRELRSLLRSLGVTRPVSTKEQAIAAVRAARRAASRHKPGGEGTIRAFAEAILRDPITYGEAVQQVRTKFPGCNTSRSSLRWYASQMRARGENLPDRPIDFHPRGPQAQTGRA